MHKLSLAKSHTEHLEELLRTPSKLGIKEPVLWSAKEINIYKPGKIELATDIDLLYWTTDRVVVGEFKTSSGHLDDVSRQLGIAYWFVRKTFGVAPECLYICGPDYQYRRIR